MKVLICAATGFEAKSVRKGLKGVKDISVLQTGMGLANARSALRDWFNNNEKPDLIISSGFAGAVDDSLSPGAWVAASDVYLWADPPKGEIKRVQSRSSLSMGNLQIMMPGMQVSAAVSATALVDYSWRPFLRLPDTKKKQIIVDMESAALADVAREQNVPFLVIRMVTDTPSRTLPEFVYDFSSVFDRSNQLKMVDRLGVAIRGLKHLSDDPGRVGSFLKESFQWGKGLTQGWQQLSKAIEQN